MRICSQLLFLSLILTCVSLIKGEEDLSFHSAGISFDNQKNLTSLPDLNLAQLASESSSDGDDKSSSGLAWDKHDFEVTNNKGGDVKVEVNLAAPMTSEGVEEDDGDLLDLLKLAQPEDAINPIELMGMMKDLMTSMKGEEQPPLNISDLVSALKGSMPPPAPAFDMNALRDLLKPQVIPPPQLDIEKILRVIQPPPAVPCPQQPLNIGSIMKEMRSAMAANNPPPAPPPGIDPKLLDLIRQTMGEMKDLHNEIANAAIPKPTPPPTPLPPQTPFVIPPPPPPPQHQQSVGAAIKSLMDQIKPPVLPPLPSAAANKELDEIKAMLKAQSLKAQSPIILPAPVIPLTKITPASVPPPPPPPSASLASQENMKNMIDSLIPPPQRIPAPPVIELKQPNCCPPPTLDDSRPDQIRCPAINGLSRPRCKRQPPPGVSVVKCKGGPCSNVDGDGDVIIDNDWANSLPFTGMNAADFNPQQLLKTLCPGGLCPEKSDIDPFQRRASFLYKSQSESV